MPKICSSKATKLVCLGLFVASLAADGYAATNSLTLVASPGNQQNAAMSIGPDGGFAVWQDDRIDGRGWGIALRRLDKDFRPTPEAPVLVNSQKSYNQQYPQVACLLDGTAIVVWQGGRRGQGDIYYRKISARGTWLTTEAFVNTFRIGEQMSPALTALAGGDAVVAWTSVNQEGAYEGVFGRRILAASGGSPDQIRLSSPNGREDHSPALASLDGGGFVCSWISGSRRYWRQGGSAGLTAGDAVVVARVFNAVGQPISGEIVVSKDGGLAVSTKVATTKDGFVVSWVDGKTKQAFFSRHDFAGNQLGAVVLIADLTVGKGAVDVVATKDELSFVWSDTVASERKERVYGKRFSLLSNSFDIAVPLSPANTSVLRETQPVVVGDGSDRVLALWSSYNIGSAFDVKGTQLR